MDRVVAAKAPLEFQMWRARLGDTFSVQQRQDFDLALKEIRLGVMLDNQASGSAAIDQTVRERIDGKTVRATLVLGCEAKRHRLQNECRALESLMRSMGNVSTKPGDERSAHYLDGQKDKHRTKWEEDRREMAAVEEQLKRLLGDAYIPTVDDPEEKPVLMRRGAKA